MGAKVYVYEDIVQRVENMIRQGVLRPGEKAPSLRRLSGRLGVSITSVLKAYTILEGRGLLEAAPQSGFYVCGPSWQESPQPEKNPTPVIPMPVAKGNLIVSFLKTINDPEIQLFGCASPDLSFLPVDELGKLLSTVGREDRESAFDYSFPPGHEGLRREIGKRSLGYGCSLTPRDIVITSGGLDALNLCLRAVTRPGDAIAIESPTYFGVLQAIEHMNLEAIEIPTCPSDGVDLDVLEPLLKDRAVKACLFIPNFNNPLGSLMPDKNKQRLAEMLARYETPLIEDDIYGDLYFGERRPKPVKAYDREGWVLMCSSFSKNLSPGLRVGFTATERYAEQVKQQQFMTTLAAASPSQEVLARFLSSGRYDRHLRTLRRQIASLVCRYQEAICNSFPKGTCISRPEGGFVLWIGLPESIDGVHFYQESLRYHISVAPGQLFTVRKDFHNYIRINCAHPWTPRVERALETLGELARKMM